MYALFHVIIPECMPGIIMKGPLEKGHYPTIPENAEVLDVTIADRICYVAFDGVFSSYALDVSEKIPVYSVVNSLLDALDAHDIACLAEFVFVVQIYITPFRGVV